MMKFLNKILFILIYFNTVNAQSSIDTFNVRIGWNLIGATISGATSEIISTIPPGIIVSSVFGYATELSYYEADTLQRGNGYWINVNQDGKVVLSSVITNGCGTVNYAGKIYGTVTIGSQCWLKENLDIGTMIPGTQNQSDNGVIEKYCYNNDPVNCNIYGGLYQWNEVMQYSITAGTGICPPGWRLPTLTDFQILSAAVNSDGNALKSVGQGVGGGAGTNSSGFSALLAGYMNFDGNFINQGEITHFWTSTQTDAVSSNSMHLGYNNNGIFLINYNKNNGFCVRCIKE